MIQREANAAADAGRVNHRRIGGRAAPWRHSIRRARATCDLANTPCRLNDDPVAHIPAVVWLAEPAGPADGPFTVRFVNEAGARAARLLPATRGAAPPSSGSASRTRTTGPRALAHLQRYRAIERQHAAARALDACRRPRRCRWKCTSRPSPTRAARSWACADSRSRPRAGRASRTSSLGRASCWPTLSRRATLNGLVASLVHELNQPLNAILNNAEAARIVLDGGAAEATDLAALLDDIIAANERAGQHHPPRERAREARRRRVQAGGPQRGRGRSVRAPRERRPLPRRHARRRTSRRRRAWSRATACSSCRCC